MCSSDSPPSSLEFTATTTLPQSHTGRGLAPAHPCLLPSRGTLQLLEASS